MSNREMVARSLAAVWHPCTQMKMHERFPLVPVARAEGPWLYDFEGRRYLDAVSSWWVNLFGHAHPAINAAITKQLDSLEHVMLAGFTHAPVVELSERLARLAPGKLGHAFYASDGASAVEIALKMAFHYWANRARRGKTRFVSLQGGYHGETAGALGVTDVEIFRAAYAPLLRESIVAPFPARSANDHRFGGIKGAVEITVPKLGEMAMEQVDHASSPFLNFAANKKPNGDPASYSFVLRGYVRHWLNNVYAEYERVGVLDRTGVPADRSQLPVLAGSIHHDFRAARGARRNRMVLVYNPHHSERARTHGNHHVYGRGNREQHPGGEFCHGTNGGRKRFHQRRAGGRLHPFSPRVDDRSGHDHRHGANGSGIRGRR